MSWKTTFLRGSLGSSLLIYHRHLGTALKFYIIVGKGLNLKVRKFLRLITTFVEVTAEKLVGEPFWSPPSWIELKAKQYTYSSTPRMSTYHEIFTNTFSSWDHVKIVLLKFHSTFVLVHLLPPLSVMCFWRNFILCYTSVIPSMLEEFRLVGCIEIMCKLL